MSFLIVLPCSGGHGSPHDLASFSSFHWHSLASQSSALPPAIRAATPRGAGFPRFQPSACSAVPRTASPPALLASPLNVIPPPLRRKCKTLRPPLTPATEARISFSKNRAKLFVSAANSPGISSSKSNPGVQACDFSHASVQPQCASRSSKKSRNGPLSVPHPTRTHHRRKPALPVDPVPLASRRCLSQLSRVLPPLPGAAPSGMWWSQQARPATFTTPHSIWYIGRLQPRCGASSLPLCAQHTQHSRAVGAHRLQRTLPGHGPTCVREVCGHNSSSRVQHAPLSGRPR